MFQSSELLAIGWKVLKCLSTVPAKLEKDMSIFEHASMFRNKF